MAISQYSTNVSRLVTVLEGVISNTYSAADLNQLDQILRSIKRGPYKKLQKLSDNLSGLDEILDASQELDRRLYRYESWGANIQHLGPKRVDELYDRAFAELNHNSDVSKLLERYGRAANIILNARWEARKDERSVHSNNVARYNAIYGNRRRALQANREDVDDIILSIQDQEEFQYKKDQREYGTYYANKLRKVRREEKVHDYLAERRKKDGINQRAFNLAMGSDYKREIESIRDKGYTREQAEALWQNNLYKEFKWLKPIAKGLGISGKNLPVIANSLRSASSVPILGGLVRHPAIAGAGLAIAGIRQFLKNEQSVTEWQKTALANGKPSSRYFEYVMSAGGDYSEALKTRGSRVATMSQWRHGESTDNFGKMALYSNGDPRVGMLMQLGMTGNHDDYVHLASQIAMTLNEGDRANFLKAAGISNTEYMGASGQSTHSSRNTGTLNLVWDWLKSFWSSDKENHSFLSENLKKAALTTAIDNAGLFFDYAPYGKAVEAALALSGKMYGDSSNADTQSSNDNHGTYIYVNGDVKTDANNIDGLANDIQSRSSVKSRQSVCAAFDSQEVR